MKRLATEAHVWLSAPDVATDPDKRAYCLSLLAPDERERFERFRFKKDRTLYLVAHALARRALSHYAAIDPTDWRFSTSAHGRPEIESPNIVPGLRFNLTHTTGLCGCLVTLNRDCGIDAEEISPRPDMKKIAERVFAPPELTAIGNIGDSRSRERFFCHWTLREAFCKALGMGLSGSSRDFYFEEVDGGLPRLRFIRDDKDSDRWQLALLRLTGSHLVAVAIYRAQAVDLDIIVRTNALCT